MNFISSTNHTSGQKHWPQDRLKQPNISAASCRVITDRELDSDPWFEGSGSIRSPYGTLTNVPFAGISYKEIRGDYRFEERVCSGFLGAPRTSNLEGTCQPCTQPVQQLSKSILVGSAPSETRDRS